MTPEAISAPYEGFRQGLCRIRGYCIQDEGDRFALAFEPWFTESDRPHAVPCLRLDFRRAGDRVRPGNAAAQRAARAAVAVTD